MGCGGKDWEGGGGGSDYTYPPDSVLIPESLRKYTPKNIPGAAVRLLIMI